MGIKIYKYLFIVILCAVLTSCGDDSSSTGPEPGEPPVIPDLEQAQPDVSFFASNQARLLPNGSVSQNGSFNSAKIIATGFAALSSIGTVYGSPFYQTDSEQATFDDGVWEWSYSHSYQNTTASYRTTAEEIPNDFIKWSMYWSYDDGGEFSIENYQLIAGTVSKDGSEGEWTFNAFGEETNDEVPFITSSWTSSSDSQKSITVNIYDDKDNSTTIDYTKNDSDYTMTISGDAEASDIVIIWNDETKLGSITQEGTTRCWDSNFQDTDCP